MHSHLNKMALNFGWESFKWAVKMVVMQKKGKQKSKEPEVQECVMASNSVDQVEEVW